MFRKVTVLNTACVLRRPRHKGFNFTTRTPAELVDLQIANAHAVEANERIPHAAAPPTASHRLTHLGENLPCRSTLPIYLADLPCRSISLVSALHVWMSKRAAQLPKVSSAQVAALTANSTLTPSMAYGIHLAERHSRFLQKTNGPDDGCDSGGDDGRHGKGAKRWTFCCSSRTRSRCGQHFLLVRRCAICEGG